MICGSEGSKRRLTTAAGAEPFGQMRDEKLHTVVARRTFSSQKCRFLDVSSDVVFGGRRMGLCILSKVSKM